MKNIKIYVAILIVGCMFSISFAGNPDRQGEAGAGELLFNPWPTSSGLHGLNVSSVTGVASLRLNIAGIGRGYDKAIIGVSNSRLYEGSGLQYNALGFAMKMSKTGSFGISLGVVDFGDIPITTVDVPKVQELLFHLHFIIWELDIVIHMKIKFQLVHLSELLENLLLMFQLWEPR